MSKNSTHLPDYKGGKGEFVEEPSFPVDPRQVDQVARYALESLRGFLPPEVLEFRKDEKDSR